MKRGYEVTRNPHLNKVPGQVGGRAWAGRAAAEERPRRGVGLVSPRRPRLWARNGGAFPGAQPPARVLAAVGAGTGLLGCWQGGGSGACLVDSALGSKL